MREGDFDWKIPRISDPRSFYSVSVGTERLIDEAQDRGVQIAMFGHTHKPYLERRGDLTVLNPGSLSFPAPGGQTPELHAHGSG